MLELLQGDHWARFLFQGDVRAQEANSLIHICIEKLTLIVLVLLRGDFRAPILI